MKSMKKCLATIAMISVMGVSGSANATLTNWFLDTDGAGSNPAVLVHDYLDLTGVAFVHNTFISATNFTFNESGLFSVLTADGGSLAGGTDLAPSLTSSFTGTGAGNIGGALSFTPGGILTVKSGAATIGTFSLTAGSATLNSGTVLPNGDISFIFKAISLASGYFFDAGNHDLATLLLNDPLALVFGFATTNVITLNNVGAPVLNLYNDTFDPDLVNPTIDQLNNLSLSNNGQFRLAVPEPGSLALLGIGLLGFASIRRRRTK